MAADVNLCITYHLKSDNLISLVFSCTNGTKFIHMKMFPQQEPMISVKEIK